MSIGYTEREQDHNYGTDYSSAGQQTQQLAAEQSNAAQPTSSRNIPVAVLLMVIGGLLLLSRAGLSLGWLWNLLPTGRFIPRRDDIQGCLVLATIASCFLFFAFSRRLYLVLIPGCILAGLSIGVLFATITSGVSVLWGLSAGFASIYLISRDQFHMQASWLFWPLVPAVPLFAIGVLSLLWLLPSLTTLLGVPLLIAGVALYLRDKRLAQAKT